MSNHYHIVIETIEGNLSAGMRQLNGVYTQSFNRRHKRVGHVYQGRFKGILVEKDSYLLELSRYVVLNPVRALMVSFPGEWKWSSYNAMIGSVTPPKCLQTDWLLSQFSLNRAHAIIQYSDFVHAGIGLPPIWQNLRNQIYLGNNDFVLRLQSNFKGNSGSLNNEIPKAQRRPPAEPLEFYMKNYPDKKESMRIAYKTGDYTLQQIASVFGVHYSTVSRAVK
jgi:hypothetical protein